MPGGMLSSSNGGTQGSGILWRRCRTRVMPITRPARILRAFDAGNVTRELWNSQQMATRDALGN
jgi:hypothetical protein